MQSQKAIEYMNQNEKTKKAMLEKHSHALRDDYNDARKSVKRKIASRTNPTTYKQICKTHKLQIQVCRREIQGRQVVRQTGQSMASMQARLVC